MTSLLTSLLIVLGRDQGSYVHTRDLDILPQPSTHGCTPQPSRVLPLGMLITVAMQPPSLTSSHIALARMWVLSSINHY